LSCIDGNSKEEILKQNKTSILSGVIETGISSTGESNSEFNCHLKIQFTDVSYHHNKKNFAFKISYFLNDDLKKPVLSLMSPTFLVLARKPNLPNSKKRTREENEEEEEEDKVELSSLSEFNTKFSEITDRLHKLEPKQRKEHMVCLFQFIFFRIF
jgi:hypothetical protein